MTYNLSVLTAPHDLCFYSSLHQLYTVCKNSFRFLGLVFPLMDWNKIISVYWYVSFASTVSTQYRIARLKPSLNYLEESHLAGGRPVGYLQV